LVKLLSPNSAFGPLLTFVVRYRFVHRLARQSRWRAGRDA